MNGSRGLFEFICLHLAWGYFSISYEKAVFSFAGSLHAVHAEDDKRDGENLTHIDGQRCLEGFLYLLGVLDKETEGEDIRQTEAEIPACANLLWR